MGFGKLITRPAAAETQERAAGAGFQVIIDSTPVHSPMQLYRGGMSIPGAWRAVTLIADLLGRLPWDAYRERSGMPLEKLTPRPPLLEQPSPPDTRMTTVSSLAMDLIWHGNSIEVVASRNAAGYPTATVPVPAEWVGVRRVDQRNYWLPEGTVEYSIGAATYAPWQIIHTKGHCEPGGLRGFGVLEAHMHGTLELAAEQQRQAASLSRHGVPTGTLESENPDLTEPEAVELKAKWLAAQRDRTIAVLNSTTKFKPLAWNPDEMQLVEARRFTLHEVALVFGLPLSFLGAEVGSKTYRNGEVEGIDLLKYTLGGHLARLEQTRSLAFPRGTTVLANLDSILRADTLSRYQAHKIGLDAKFLTLDEVRELENRPPLPEPEPTPPAATAPAPAADDADPESEEP